MFINKTLYYKADRHMKLRWKCRLKPWEDDTVFIFSQVDRTRVLDANEMRGGAQNREKLSGDPLFL